MSQQAIAGNAAIKANATLCLLTTCTPSTPRPPGSRQLNPGKTLHRCPGLMRTHIGMRVTMSHLPERQGGPMTPKAQQDQSLKRLSMTSTRFSENPVCVAIWWAKCRNTHSLNSLKTEVRTPKAALGQAHASESKSLILLPKHTH